MANFIQLHLLTSYAAANLNRDDTGRPKTLNYGGAERLRVSSQSLKRAFRTSDVFFEALPDALGKRSQQFADALLQAVIGRGVPEDVATKRVAALIEHDKMGKVKKGVKTEQLVHLGPDELQQMANFADQLADGDLANENVALVLKDKPRAADIAMFGRMLADNTAFNVEAAVQVAHAFTTHRVVVEDDFYTAVDDIKNADVAADAGAGFLGVQQFGAGTFYLYICVDSDQLLENLAGDRALASDTIGALVRAAATVSPSGKQNSFGSRALASYLMLETGRGAPRSLGSAFEYPVGSHAGESDYLKASIQRLQKMRTGFAVAYDETFKSMEMQVGIEGSPTLADVIAAATETIEG